MRNLCKTLIILSVFCVSCSQQAVHYQRTLVQFSTITNYHIYEEKESFLDEIVREGNAYSKALNRYEKDNQLYTLNHTHESIDADPILLGCLQRAIEIQTAFPDYYSFTMGKLKDAYEDAFEKKQLPEVSLVSSLLEEAKDTTVAIDGNKIRRVGEGEIDFGSIAKGYFLSQMKKRIDEEHLCKYYFDMGSSSILFGEYPADDNSFFVVNVKGNETISFKAKNIALSTSAISEQRHVIDDEVYSHIISPIDGSAQPLHEMVTFIGAEAWYLDALTTAAMNMPVEEIEKLGIDGFVIDNGEVTYRHGV